MISNDGDLGSAQAELSKLNDSLLKLRRDTMLLRPKAYAVMSQSYTHEIANLTEAICTYLSIPIVRLPEDADVSLRLKGKHVELGELSASAVGDCLTKFQSGVSNIAFASYAGDRGRAAQAEKSCGYTLAGVGRGSVTLFLNAKQDLTQEGTSPDGDLQFVAKNLIDGIRDCTSMDSDLPAAYLSRDFDANAVKYEVFRTIASLVPEDKPVEGIEISFARRENDTAPTTAYLSQAVALRAKRWSKQIASHGVRATIVGVIRGADLDSRRVKITDPTSKKKVLAYGLCPVGMEVKINNSCGKKVSVVGILKTIGNKKNIDIENIEPVHDDGSSAHRT